jgi:hypothetical protein
MRIASRRVDCRQLIRPYGDDLFFAREATKRNSEQEGLTRRRRGIAGAEDRGAAMRPLGFDVDGYDILSVPRLSAACTDRQASHLAVGA